MAYEDKNKEQSKFVHCQCTKIFRVFASTVQGRLNQLGGVFINGKPLPLHVRQRIVDMAEMGLRPCEISRRLRVSHGCISKILAKYHETGSCEAGSVPKRNRKRSQIVNPIIERKITEYTENQPGIFSWEVRELLLKEEVCTRENLPTLNAISLMLKSKATEKKEEPKSSDEKKQESEESETRGKEATPDNGTFSIARLLNLPGKDKDIGEENRCVDLGMKTFLIF